MTTFMASQAEVSLVDKYLLQIMVAGMNQKWVGTW